MTQAEFEAVEARVVFAVLEGHIQVFPGVGWKVLADKPPNPGGSYFTCDTLEQCWSHLRWREQLKLQHEKASSGAAR